MKLTIRSYRDMHGNDLPVLCDEEGNMLPGQTKVALEHKANDVPKVTVEFMLDGDSIKAVDGPANTRPVRLKMRDSAA